MAPISHEGNPSSSDNRQNGHVDTLNGSSININGDHANGNGNGVNGNGLTVFEPEPMAIIGMACQFPQEAENPEKFWTLLVEGKSAMTEFPQEKLDINSHYHPDPAHGSSVSNTL
jgi:hypothetical protein